MSSLSNNPASTHDRKSQRALERKLPNRATTHQGIKQSSKKANRPDGPPRTESQRYQSRVPSGTAHQTTDKASARTSIYTDAEKKERKKRQNTESARRCRERKRVEMKRMEQVFDANERRIENLEVMVDELYGELGSADAHGSKRSLRIERKDSRTDNDTEGGSGGGGTDRPTWFGATFWEGFFRGLLICGGLLRRPSKL